MKINYNMSAYVANAKLLQNEDALTASLEKLSSGYRINHASDDPAGMALSAKMRTQIRGLEQASRNASDGMSVIETAEGALQEVTSIIQRMRELAVQAGNDTYGDDDRQAMQDEIEALKDEIDRISTDTEFNKMTLLDGSLSSRVYANTRQVSLVEVSSTVDTGDYTMTVKNDATRAVLTAKMAAGDADTYKTDPDDPNKLVIPEGQISINGVVVRFKGGETEEEVYTTLRDACEKAEVNLVCYDGDANYVPPTADVLDNLKTEGYIPETDGYQFGDALAFIAQSTGKSEQVTISCSDDNIAKFFGLTTEEQTVRGTDVEIELTGDKFTKQATVLTDGNTVSITDRNGFSMSFDVIEGGTYAIDPGTGLPVGSMDIVLQVTNIGNMSLQVGANQYQTIEVDIPDMSSKALRIDDLDVTTVFGPDKAMSALDAALAKVTSARSSLGAAENRLDYAVDNLGETDENMNAALSRIEDVDMATEMSTYTQMNVLVQAATSVLAQANDLPEQTLQLLQ